MKTFVVFVSSLSLSTRCNPLLTQEMLRQGCWEESQQSEIYFKHIAHFHFIRIVQNHISRDSKQLYGPEQLYGKQLYGNWQTKKAKNDGQEMCN